MRFAPIFSMRAGYSPRDRQNLCFSGERIDTDGSRTLASLGVGSGCRLELYWKAAPRRVEDCSAEELAGVFPINVKTVTGARGGRIASIFSCRRRLGQQPTSALLAAAAALLVPSLRQQHARPDLSRTHSRHPPAFGCAGKTIAIQVTPLDTIHAVKAKIQEEEFLKARAVADVQACLVCTRRPTVYVALAHASTKGQEEAAWPLSLSKQCIPIAPCSCALTRLS